MIFSQFQGLQPWAQQTFRVSYSFQPCFLLCNVGKDSKRICTLCTSGKDFSSAARIVLSGTIFVEICKNQHTLNCNYCAEYTSNLTVNPCTPLINCSAPHTSFALLNNFVGGEPRMVLCILGSGRSRTRFETCPSRFCCDFSRYQ